MNPHAASSRAADPSRGDEYAPVSCSFHDVLEDAAVRRTVRDITFRDAAGAERRVRSTIDDVWSKDGEEFARLGTGEVVRLDRLELA